MMSEIIFGEFYACDDQVIREISTSSSLLSFTSDCIHKVCNFFLKVFVPSEHYRRALAVPRLQGLLDYRVVFQLLHTWRDGPNVQF